MENMFEMLEEEMTSSLSPYISRLFLLIEKETPDKLSFVEWLPAVCVYCLYPNERIVSFVFSMIDEDHDSCISKKDMIKFLVTNRYGIKIFPFNYVKAVELLEVTRSDKITMEDFLK
jgi:Ca2+-binding EF-hand superfamily protein